MSSYIVQTYQTLFNEAGSFKPAQIDGWDITTIVGYFVLVMGIGIYVGIQV